MATMRKKKWNDWEKEILRKYYNKGLTHVNEKTRCLLSASADDIQHSYIERGIQNSASRSVLLRNIENWVGNSGAKQSDLSPAEILELKSRYEEYWLRHGGPTQDLDIALVPDIASVLKNEQSSVSVDDGQSLPLWDQSTLKLDLIETAIYLEKLATKYRQLAECISLGTLSKEATYVDDINLDFKLIPGHSGSLRIPVYMAEPDIDILGGAFLLGEGHRESSHDSGHKKTVQTDRYMGLT